MNVGSACDISCAIERCRAEAIRFTVCTCCSAQVLQSLGDRQTGLSEDHDVHQASDAETSHGLSKQVSYDDDLSPLSLADFSLSDRDLVSTGLGSPAVRLFPTCRRPPCLLLRFVLAVVRPCLEPDRNGPGTSLVFRYVPSFRRRIANEETSATSG